MMIFCVCTEALRVACVRHLDVLELIAPIQVLSERAVYPPGVHRGDLRLYISESASST